MVPPSRAVLYGVARRGYGQKCRGYAGRLIARPATPPVAGSRSGRRSDERGHPFARSGDGRCGGCSGDTSEAPAGAWWPAGHVAAAIGDPAGLPRRLVLHLLLPARRGPALPAAAAARGDADLLPRRRQPDPDLHRALAVHLD